MLPDAAVELTAPPARVLSVIFPFCGRYERVEEGIFLRLREMEPCGKKFEFVFVLDGPLWKTLPLVQTLPERFPQATLVEVDPQTDLPAALFNAGIGASHGEAVAFALANQPWIAANYERLAQAAQAGGPERAYYLSFPEMLVDYPFLPTKALLHGWQQYRPWLAITAAAVPRELARRNQVFDESPLLQTACDWDWFLRLSKIAEIRHVGEHAGPATAAPLERYPLARRFRPSRDLQHRYVVRAKAPTRGARYSGSAGNGASAEWCQESFLRDVPPGDADYLRHRAEAFGLTRECVGPTMATCCPSLTGQTGHAGKPDVLPGNGIVDISHAGPYKIAITGGDWEYQHNRLYFFEYLDHLQGSGLGSYKVLLDRVVTAADLAGNDLVILTRARCDRLRFILDTCAAMKIPTLYMIDDNWLSVGADYPDHYAQLFSPGRPDYENFLFALRRATATLTCSMYLAEDIAPHARRVLCLPMSVPLAAFESVPRPPPADGFVVGFAGSLRHNDAAFAALAAVGRQRNDVRVLLFGALSPEQERMFQGLRPMRLPPDTYDGYIRQIRQAGPDMLVAPLENTRTAQSKAPTKYLEITAAGAAGVYSAVPPYVGHVTHGKNGILVQDSNSEAEWREAIESLLERREITRIWQAARDDVGKHYDVPVVAEQFRRMILDFLS
jgi:glycosyltransferase involved in cell wall biosynthesis